MKAVRALLGFGFFFRAWDQVQRAPGLTVKAIGPPLDPAAGEAGAVRSYLERLSGAIKHILEGHNHGVIRGQ